MAAMLMAVVWRGLDDEELMAVTRTMIGSGETWSWDLGRPVGDKHSTGGVGDKVSIPLAPVLAACGLAVPMVSGRGLGHTGGTLDKLESIPGFRTDLGRHEFERLLADVGYAMGGQTGTFAPLDRELYALRDVTGTVESVPLIVASIVSKKVAEGLDALILDVKWGDGAFMRERDEAETLARRLVRVAGEFGVRTSAVLTDMDQPLGRTVGNALEIRESIEMLRGEGVESRFDTVVRALAARLLVLAGVDEDEDDAAARVDEAVGSGEALDRFRRNLEAQGGDPAVVDEPDRLPAAVVRREVVAERGGWIARLRARAVGEAVVALGGGRRKKGDEIDRSVGFEIGHTVGEEVVAGEAWAVVHARTEPDVDEAERRLLDAVEWSTEPVESRPVVTTRVEATETS